MIENDSRTKVALQNTVPKQKGPSIETIRSFNERIRNQRKTQDGKGNSGVVNPPVIYPRQTQSQNENLPKIPIQPRKKAQKEKQILSLIAENSPEVKNEPIPTAEYSDVEITRVNSTPRPHLSRDGGFGSVYLSGDRRSLPERRDMECVVSDVATDELLDADWGGMFSRVRDSSLIPVGCRFRSNVFLKLLFKLDIGFLVVVLGCDLD